MKDKIRLEISSLSNSRAQTGAFALVLNEVEGNRSLPIIIGSFEAQAIALEMESIKASRPLTHDIFKSFATAFNVIIKEVLIYNLIEGVFYAKLFCEDSFGKKAEIDTRTSDAIALAVRFKSPVYTYEFILNKAGVIIDEDAEIRPVPEIVEEDISVGIQDVEKMISGDPIRGKTIVELNELLNNAIASEDYEFASKIRDELERRK